MLLTLSSKGLTLSERGLRQRPRGSVLQPNEEAHFLKSSGLLPVQALYSDSIRKGSLKGSHCPPRSQVLKAAESGRSLARRAALQGNGFKGIKPYPSHHRWGRGERVPWNGAGEGGQLTDRKAADTRLEGKMFLSGEGKRAKGFYFIF